MSKENNNPENGAQTDEEITAILKRLSQLLDKSVSLDEAVDLAKKQADTTEDTSSDEQPAEEISAEDEKTDIIPEEDAKTEEEPSEELTENTNTEDKNNGQLSFDFASEDNNGEKSSSEAQPDTDDNTEQVQSIFEFIKAEETNTEETAAEAAVAEAAVAEPENNTEEINEEKNTEYTEDDDEDAELNKLIKNLEKAWADFEKESGTSDVTAATENSPKETSEEENGEIAVTETEEVKPIELTIENAEEPIVSRSPLTADTDEAKEEDNTNNEQLSDTDKIVESITGKPADAPESSKIFDELLACFEDHKIPDDFRFTEAERNTESINIPDISDILSTNEEVGTNEDTPVEEAPSSKYPWEELSTEENNEDNAENTTEDESEEILFEETADNEEADEPFTPIEHDAPQEEDELFSKIFSDEKDERKNKEKDKKKWQKQGDGGSAILSGLFDWLEVIVLSAAFALVLFTFVMRLAVVDGDSMNHTLHDKELLIISDLMYTPENNDIIVFTSPNYPEPIVKRVIATEGQTVDIDFSTWTVTVDGVLLDEDYVNRVAGSMDDSDVTFPLTVEEGHVFVMGDNRNESLDSRNSRIGLVDVRNILGEVKIRLFPFDRFGKVD